MAVNNQRCSLPVRAEIRKKHKGYNKSIQGVQPILFVQIKILIRKGDGEGKSGGFRVHKERRGRGRDDRRIHSEGIVGYNRRRLSKKASNL